MMMCSWASYNAIQAGRARGLPDSRLHICRTWRLAFSALQHTESRTHALGATALHQRLAQAAQAQSRTHSSSRLARLQELRPEGCPAMRARCRLRRPASKLAWRKVRAMQRLMSAASYAVVWCNVQAHWSGTCRRDKR